MSVEKGVSILDADSLCKSHNLHESKNIIHVIRTVAAKILKSNSKSLASVDFSAFYARSMLIGFSSSIHIRPRILACADRIPKKKIPFFILDLNLLLIYSACSDIKFFDHFYIN